MKLELTKQELELLLDIISLAESEDATVELRQLREKVEKALE